MDTFSKPVDEGATWFQFPVNLPEQCLTIELSIVLKNPNTSFCLDTLTTCIVLLNIKLEN